MTVQPVPFLVSFARSDFASSSFGSFIFRRSNSSALLFPTLWLPRYGEAVIMLALFRCPVCISSGNRNDFLRLLLKPRYCIPPSWRRLLNIRQFANARYLLYVLRIIVQLRCIFFSLCGRP